MRNTQRERTLVVPQRSPALASNPDRCFFLSAAADGSASHRPPQRTFARGPRYLTPCAGRGLSRPLTSLVAAPADTGYGRVRFRTESSLSTCQQPFETLRGFVVGFPGHFLSEINEEEDSMRIRSWLRKAEETRRTIVEVEEKTAEELRTEEERATDARHGILPLSGRRVA